MTKTVKMTYAERQHLAETVAAWKAGTGLSTPQAAQLLGMSSRTLEGVLQGRGFSYPILLYFAIQSWRQI